MRHVDLVGNVLLAAHRVEGQLVVSRLRADEVQTSAGIDVVKTMTQGLAVNGNELASKCSADGNDKGGAALAELVRINRGDDATEGVVTG
jgi:hypothetical protein